MSTARGAEVLTPTFITLMHELGHALKIAVGGYLPDDTTLMQHFIEGITPDQKKYWKMIEARPNMLEELVNILGIENPVRAESGLGSREIYQSTKEVSVQQAKDKFDAITKLDHDHPGQYMTTLSSAWMKLNKTSITPEEVTAIHDELDTIDEDSLLSAKKAKAAELRAELDEFTAGKDGSRITKTMRYRAFRKAVDTATADPSLKKKELTPLIDDLAALKSDRDTLIKAGKVLAKGKAGAQVDEGGSQPGYTIPKK